MRLFLYSTKILILFFKKFKSFKSSKSMPWVNLKHLTLKKVLFPMWHFCNTIKFKIILVWLTVDLDLEGKTSFLMELFIAIVLPIVLLVALTLLFISEGIPSWIQQLNRNSSTFWNFGVVVMGTISVIMYLTRRWKITILTRRTSVYRDTNARKLKLLRLILWVLSSFLKSINYLMKEL